MATRKYDKQVFAIRDNQNGGKSFWTQIGVGWINADGSINLKLNTVPTDWTQTTIQVRDPKAEEDRAAA